MRLQKMLAAAVAALICLCMLPAAWGEADILVSADIGYDGLVTYLSTMPLRVTLENGGGDAELVVAVNVNRTELEYDRYEYPITLAGGAKMQLVLPLRINYKQSSYVVEVLRDGKAAAQCEVKPQRVVSPATLLVGVLSADAQALSYMNINAANDTLVRGDVWQTVALAPETFPENVEMLDAFRILAVDGVDVSALSEPQQQALREWINNGGVVIVGGGAAGIAASRGFTALTGVMAAAPYQAQGVDRALLDYLSSTRFAMSAADSVRGDVLLSTLRGGSGTLVSLGDAALIDRCCVGNGVIYTTAFSLSEKPLSTWSGMNGFWQRMLLSADSSLYQRIMNELNNYYNRDNWYPDSYLLSSMELENDNRMLLAVLVIALFILLTGVGSYVILKRLDKREWMWLTVPVLSLCSAGVLLLMGRGMAQNRPALASYTVTTVDQSGYTSSMTMAGIAASSTQPLTVSALDGGRIYTSAEYLNYYTEEELQKKEKKLRYVYSQGKQTSLTLPGTSAWEVRELLIAPKVQKQVPVSGGVWWEKDGLHGEIHNGSDITLSSGYVFTTCGFCSIPALQPGETAEFAIVEVKKEEKKQDPQAEIVYRDGELIAENQYIGIYDILNSALFGDEKRENMTSKELERRHAERNLLQSAVRTSDMNAFFHYVTFADGIQPSEISVNGEKVQRAVNRSVLDVQLRYDPVSQSGMVKLTRGMAPLYGVTLDEHNHPASNGVKADGYTYYSLRDEPMICFDLSLGGQLDMSKVGIDKVTFTCEVYSTNPCVWLYNAEDERWEEAQYTTLPIVFNGESMQRYLSDQGQLFIRFTQRTAENREIYNPALTLEGRLK